MSISFSGWLGGIWNFLLESSPYILLGLVLGGLIHAFLPKNFVREQLGQGRYSSVFKASLIGIPLPLCSCGVLPAAASLKKEGANNGATTAFLISTPESGADSIAVTYALLGAPMAILRPLLAFVGATTAGLLENLFFWESESSQECSEDSHLVACCKSQEKTCCSSEQESEPEPVSSCCETQEEKPVSCCGHSHSPLQEPSFTEKLKEGLNYGLFQLWGELAPAFFVGVIVGGLILAQEQDSMLTSLLQQKSSWQFLIGLLLISMTVYICATASTPLVAALMAQGLSPGAGMLILLAGPATNLASLSVLVKVLGGRATALYLATIAGFSLFAAKFVDYLFVTQHWPLEINVAGHTHPVMVGLEVLCAIIIILLSIRPIIKALTPSKKA